MSLAKPLDVFDNVLLQCYVSNFGGLVNIKHVGLLEIPTSKVQLAP